MYIRRHSILAPILLLLTAHFAGGQPSRPNIIFMMSDDHGYQAVSAYGHGLNHTPHLDRLASRGMLFDRAFVTNSLCGPSRAVFLTGKHSHVNGFRDNQSVFDAAQPTVAKMLKAAGYQTAVFGKWHLVSDPQGFDHWNILPGQGDYYNPRFIENGVKKTLQGYVTNLTVDLALQWLDKRDPDRPFFLVCNQKAPHRNWMPEAKYYHLYDSAPLPPPPNFRDDYATRTRAAREQEMEVARDMHPYYDLKLGFDLPQEERKGLAAGWQSIYDRLGPQEKRAWEQAYGPGNEAFRQAGLTGRELADWKYRRYMQDYLRCVQSVDDNVGKLLDYLERNGLAGNTIVIYTSDQGFYLGEHGWFDKRFMYEESFRTPLIVRWPGVTDAGGRTSSMVQNIDFAGTILDMAGLPIPRDMQGLSMVPVLKGSLKGDLHDALYYHYYESGEHRVARHFGIRTDRWKLIRFEDNDEWELYDLRNDPREMDNLHGRPGWTRVSRSLTRRLEALAARYGDDEALAELGRSGARR
jgi:arylsulfatase A-like enzyme